ncbi:TPA: hypothetical protein ACKE6T_003940 [Klebsiella oxytoca]
MKRLFLSIPLLLYVSLTSAECRLLQSQQNLSYGHLSAAERQAQGEIIALPEKQVVLNITCDEPQQIRLFTGTATPEGSQFAFGEHGRMLITASQAVVDDNPVRLAAVHAGDASLMTNGADRITAQVNQGIAFVNGQELKGKTASVTLTIKPNFKSGSITDKTTWRGNLRVRMVTQ